MSNVIELLQSQMSDQAMDTLMQQVGARDKEQARTAANGIMSTLMGALAKNAQTPQGRDSLNQALEQDHDGSILDQLGDLFEGNTSNLNSRAANGAGILKHVLGDKQEGASDLVSKMSGLDKGAVTSMMVKMAPVVLGLLGRQKRQQGLDAGGLASLLSGTVQSQANKGNEMGLVGKFLDRDGDGSVMDDLLRMGGKALGGFLKK